MEAARPTARSREARSHEESAGPNQEGFQPQNATYQAGTTSQYKTPSSAEPAQHSAKKQRYKHQNDTVNPANTPYQPDTAKERLKFTEEPAQSSTGAKSRQHGTKYQQKFSPEAAKPEKTDSSPSVNSGRLQFTADEKPLDEKLSKLQNNSDKATVKLDKARGNLPTKKRIKTQRVYDEAKGKAKTKFQLENEVVPMGKKPSVPARAGKAAGHGVTRAGINKVHQKISEVENDNVGVKSAHKIEQTAENTYRGGRTARSAFRFVKERPYRRVAKLEKKTTKANIKLDYRQALNDNPKLKSNILSRMMQKQKIKRQYAKAAREAQKAAGKTAKKTSEKLAAGARAVFRSIRRHPGIAVALGALALLIVFIMTAVSSCSNMAAGGMGAVFGTSYLSKDSDIDNAELIYTEWEADLQMQVKDAENTHPGYDEYRYNVSDIGHDPYELMGFLTAKYQEFEFADIQAILQQIFAEQYQLSYVEEIETRYNDPNDENGDGDLEEYEWRILNVNVAARSFSEVVASRLTSDEQMIFDLLLQSKGNRQYAYSPFDFNWLPYVTSYYGWRVHPISGEKDYHKAVDIAVAQGTEIIAAHDGTVTTAAFDDSYGNYIVLDNGEGLVTKYAHCSQLLVSVGQQVTVGSPIAKVGSTGDSTGAHLHFEVLHNGQYLNPLYFAVTNDDGTGRIPPGSPGGPEYPSYPGAPLGDGSYAAMIAEAEKHLGKRYVFGASGPDNFDCSGFVCWVLDKSGVKPMSRTTAQGIYNMCTPVSPSEAKPGDLIFFTGTYSTPNPVSHIGIYVGNGMMLHCGDPIQYTSINTSYWQNHFYAFGRIN